MQVNLPTLNSKSTYNNKSKPHFKGFKSSFESPVDLFTHVATPKNADVRTFNYSVADANEYIQKLWKALKKLEIDFKTDEMVKIEIQKAEHGNILAKVEPENIIKKSRKYGNMVKIDPQNTLTKDIKGPMLLNVDLFVDNITAQAELIKNIFK